MKPRREYLRSALGELLQAGEVCIREAKEARRSLAEVTSELLGEEEEFDFFSSYEISHSLTLAYPREMFEQIAEKAGVPHAGREILDLVRELHQKGKI